MAIKFNCPKCGQELIVKDELAGKAGKCPRCKATVTVPVPTAPSPRPAPAKKKVEDIEEIEEIEDVEVIDEDDRPRKSSKSGKKNDFDFTDEEEDTRVSSRRSSRRRDDDDDDDDEPRRKRKSRRDDDDDDDDDRVTRRKKVSARRGDDDEEEDDEDGGGSEKRKKARDRQRRAAWKKATTGVFLNFISMCTYTGACAVLALCVLIGILATIANSTGIAGISGILIYLVYGLLFVSWILFIVGGAFFVTAPGKNGEMGLGIATLAVGAVALLFWIYLFVGAEIAFDVFGGSGMRGSIFIILLAPLLEVARLALFALFMWAVAKTMKERALVDTSLMLAIIIPSTLFAMILITYLLGLALFKSPSKGTVIAMEFLVLCETGGWAGLMAWKTLHTMAVKDSMEQHR